MLAPFNRPNDRKNTDDPPLLKTPPTPAPLVSGFVGAPETYRALEMLWANRINKEKDDLLRWIVSPPANSGPTRLMVEALHRVVTNVDLKAPLEYLTIAREKMVDVAIPSVPGRAMHLDPQFQKERDLARALNDEQARNFALTQLFAPQPALSKWIASTADTLSRVIVSTTSATGAERNRHIAKGLFTVNALSFMALQTIVERHLPSSLRSITDPWASGGALDAATAISDNLTCSVSASILQTMSCEDWKGVFETLDRLVAPDVTRQINRISNDRHLFPVRHLLYVAAQTPGHVRAAVSVAVQSLDLRETVDEALIDPCMAEEAEGSIANASAIFDTMPVGPLFYANAYRDPPILMAISGIDGVGVAYEADAEAYHMGKPWLEKLSAFGSFDFASSFSLWYDRSGAVSTSLLDRFHSALDYLPSRGTHELQKMAGISLHVFNTICQRIAEMYGAQGPVFLVDTPDGPLLFHTSADKETFSKLTPRACSCAQLSLAECLSMFSPEGLPPTSVIPLPRIDFGEDNETRSPSNSLDEVKRILGDKIPSYDKILQLLSPFGIEEIHGTGQSHRYLRRNLPNGGHAKVTVYPSVYDSTESIHTKIFLRYVRGLNISPEDLLASLK